MLCRLSALGGALLLCAVAAAWALGCDARSTAAGDKARVVSLSPNTTETAFALGAAEQLVGRSRHCDYPRAARALPAVGGFADPSVEAIVGLSPTLVIGSQSPAGPGLARTLTAHRIDSYFPPTGSVDEIQQMIRGLGERLGRPAQGDKLAAQVGRDVARIAAAASRAKRLRAVLLFDASPIVVAGPGGFPDELLRLAGGDNVITRGGAYPTVNIERLLALDPDVVIDASAVGTGEMQDGAAPGQRSQLVDRPGWSELRASKEGRLRTLAGSAALRPGPRIADGLAQIFAALHGREPTP
ncbi:MAG: ABC transporter substrate-binding protein [Deltaproteobacteria bacterium]|jgi:iron complex transport system substrate-binding protein|nr:ABC transporter substrate-binding protein [Deltaproteobacteria bacterium]MBW2534440.1 ABC transporter substrate-binding protein [Deltaproteobacteria bacterium]